MIHTTTLKGRAKSETGEPVIKRTVNIQAIYLEELGSDDAVVLTHDEEDLGSDECVDVITRVREQVTPADDRHRQRVSVVEMAQPVDCGMGVIYHPDSEL